jgi:replication factor C subunit 3/5
MSFRQKHQPAAIKDLVFRDPKVAQIVAEYADGTRTKHLLLEGSTSSGKSEAARLIIKERLSTTMGPSYNSIYHGQGFNTGVLKQIEGDWNTQMSFSGCAYSVINEVDFAGNPGCREIRKFIDSKEHGTLICTTNHLHKLEPAFVSRFYVVEVEPPLAAHWYLRALDILQSEGHAVTMPIIQALFANFNGHARDFMDVVEDANIKQRSSRASSAGHPVTKAGSTVFQRQKPVNPSIHVAGALQAKTIVKPSTFGGHSDQ